MTELLNQYEKSFRKNSLTIMDNFNKFNLEPNQDIAIGKKIKINKTSLLDENDKLIEEQQKILKQMEIEILSLSKGDLYDEYKAKISSFKKTIDLNKKKLNDLYSKEDSKNSSFMSENYLLSEKNSILINQEKYRFQTNEKLQHIRRSLTNSEEMGTNIMVNMDNQSKSMKNVTGKLRKMGNNLKESNKILNIMKSRNTKNKKIIIIFGILLALILTGILTAKLYRKYK